MGLVAGVLLEKSKADSPSVLNEKVKKFVEKVPQVMQNVLDYAQIVALLD